MIVEKFLEEQTEKLKKLSNNMSMNAWMAQTTGKKEWVDRLTEAEGALNSFLSDSKRYEQIEHLLNTSLTRYERKQLLKLKNEMKQNQLSEDILMDLSKRSAELNFLFNTYVPKVDEKGLSANDIREILVNSTDNRERELAWKASKEVGQVVEQQLLELIRKRNEAAKILGYGNHHQMAFELQELDRDEVFASFNQLLKLSDPVYRELKNELDLNLASRFNLDVKDLRPWHYSDPFFQSAPATEATNLDRFFKNKDIIELNTRTFESMGIDIKNLYENSDLFPREGKNPTAFCMDLDREGDTRVLCNITPTAYWMGTTLHEFGHAAYNKYVDPELPYLLRSISHILTTEAIAMIFGKMVNEPEWLETFLEVDSEELQVLKPNLKKYQQLNMLAAARFIITFVFFEKELYENPEQDLNALWWKLVKEIQHLTPPDNRDAPDWAAKIHFTLAPVYYQNYLLGELTSAQLHQYIKTNISTEFFNEQVGHFIISKFLKPGASLHWNEKIEKATGEPLNPQYFVDAFC
ncbi:M2 family metallopeptidase [Litchfieldia alkalitelluris]|uniref:M2 family metallopeptidase n=1 Tax=Litchfieldia alkalitelluris TaxID=304268 RepID=UPI000997109C|nr:M2 family metallopeptidase [Litchfieldia alkalitelluris]